MTAHLQPCECAEVEQVHVLQDTSWGLATMHQQHITTDSSSTGAARAGCGTAMVCLQRHGQHKTVRLIIKRVETLCDKFVCFEAGRASSLCVC
jgi:hypothetical protein